MNAKQRRKQKRYFYRKRKEAHARDWGNTYHGPRMDLAHRMRLAYSQKVFDAYAEYDRNSTAIIRHILNNMPEAAE